MDEEGPIATLGLSQEQETVGKGKSCEGKKDSENYSGERSISSSEESDFSVEDDIKYRKEDVFYFDFEEKGITSELDSLVDSIENFARSVDGLSCLSEIGFEELEEKVFDQIEEIEEKVIQEYGLDCIQKYGDNIDDEKSRESKPRDDHNGEKVESLDQENAAATAAEILDDIINAEHEEKQVVYEPKKTESSKRSFVREALGIIRNTNTSTADKKNKLDDDNEIEIHEPDESITTKPANNPMENSILQDDSRQEADDSDEDECTGNNDNNSVSKQPKNRCSNAGTDQMSDESIGDEGIENLIMSVDTTEQPNESIAQGDSNEEIVWDQKSTPLNSVHRDYNSDSLNSKINHKGDNVDKEQANNRTKNFEGSESGSQHEYQNLEIIHGPNGPLIRTTSFHRTPSVKSSSTTYDNMEVVYDPALFRKSLRKQYNNLPKKSNSCCDLREIATTLRPKNLETKQKVEKHSSESVDCKIPIPPKPSKIVEKQNEKQDASLSAEHGQSIPPSEFEGFEIRLNLDCYNIASSEKSLKKKNKNRSKSLTTRRRLLDPERLICGLKPQQRRPPVSGKKKTKAAKDAKSESPVKEKTNNTSMDTTLTIPTEDEDGLPQYQTEVRNSPGMSSKDPLISVVSQNSRRSHSRKIRKSGSRESFSDVKSESSNYSTRISVTTNGSTSFSQDKAPQEALSSEDPSISHPTAAGRETNSRYGGELVDLLHQISSYVDGIVENNNYSLTIPSRRPRSQSPTKKDGNEADDEQSTTKSDVADDSNSAVGAITREVKQDIFEPMNLRNTKTPEKFQREKENEQKKSDLLSLFDTSPIRSTGSLSSHEEETKKQSNTLPVIDGDESDNSSAIVGSSVGRPVPSQNHIQQQLEAPQENWEKAPVIYHMKSSPPQAKRAYRNAQRRTGLNRTMERHPLRVNTKSKDLSNAAAKATSFDDDDKPNRSIRARATEEMTKQSKASRNNSAQVPNKIDRQKENLPSQPLLVQRESSISNSFGSTHHPAMTFREEGTVTKSSFHRMNNSNVVTSQRKKNKPLNHSGRKPESHRKVGPRSNGFVVDENGFILKGKATLRKDVEKRTSFFEMLERGSAPVSLRSHEPVAKSVGMTGETKVFLREPSRMSPCTIADNRIITGGDRPKRSTRSQFQSGSSESFLKPVSQGRGQAVPSR